MPAVLFDMDGVIVDSEDYWIALLQDDILPAAVDGDVPDADTVQGMNYREIYDHLDDRYDLVVDQETFMHLFEEAAADLYHDRVALMDGFGDLVAWLKAHDCPVAIVSASPPEWIGVVTDRFDLDVDAVYSVEHIDDPGKPEPHIYEHAADDLGVEPGECIAVEDSKHGIAAAKQAGMTVIGYRAGAGEADLVVDGPEQLFEELAARTARGR